MARLFRAPNHCSRQRTSHGLVFPYTNVGKVTYGSMGSVLYVLTNDGDMSKALIANSVYSGFNNTLILFFLS